MESPLPLYDKLGTPTVFFVESGGARFIDLSGASVAYLMIDNVYAYRGNHIGWWEGDRILGHDGGLMLWAEGVHVPGIYLPKPFKGYTMPTPGPPAGKNFINTPPDKPISLAGWSRDMWGVW
jgi:hypothetical protein